MAHGRLESDVHPEGIVVTGLVSYVNITSFQWDKVRSAKDCIHSSGVPFATGGRETAMIMQSKYHVVHIISVKK